MNSDLTFLSSLFMTNFIPYLYNGTSFPEKYLVPETIAPTTSDLESYLTGVKKIVDAIAREPNVTDANRALGIFFMRAILKRTVIENKHKIQEKYVKNITDIIKQADYFMSHFYYLLRNETSGVIYRVVEILRDDTMQVKSIANFNRNRLKKWVLSRVHINKFAQAMDEVKLAKEEYLEFFENNDYFNYVITIEDSGNEQEIERSTDECLSKIIYNPMPWDMELRPCVSDRYCANVVYRSPSVAYSLSHRLLNIMMPRHLRRCYSRSAEEDDRLMDKLCASMYRETVYLARRGYFFRDMFLEHVALCAMLGYEEFHRRHWFKKVISWIDNDGCIQENLNFEMNRTKYRLKGVENYKLRLRIKEVSDKVLATKCSFHQMALAVVMLAHGVRHAMHFINL